MGEVGGLGGKLTVVDVAAKGGLEPKLKFFCNAAKISFDYT